MLVKFEVNLKWKLKDYQSLYLNCDILLLADVFEKCKDNNSKNYRLCPSHYLSTAASTSDAMLNMTKIELELIWDSDIYLVFEKVTRDGVSYISKSYQ